MIFDRLGTLYGTAWLGGANGSGTAYSMTPSLGNWTFNVLYSFPSSDLNGPTSTLVMDSAGNLYGTTLGSYRGPNYGTVFKLTLSNGNWIESDLHDFTGGNDGSNPLGGMLAVDASGNVYGTAQGGGTHGQGVVFKIAP
jgi:uncharacterized repeat protein (TIGR03803 family)